MGPGIDGGYIGIQAFFTNFTEIRFLRQPESTSTSAAAAPPPGSKTQTDMVRAAGAHPVQHRQQLEPLPNATVMGAQRDNSENGGKPQLNPANHLLCRVFCRGRGGPANPVPTCTASPRAPVNADARAVVSAPSAAAEHPTASSAEAPAGAWGRDVTTQYCWQGGSL